MSVREKIAHIIALATILALTRSSLVAPVPNTTLSSNASSSHWEMRKITHRTRRSANTGVLDRVRWQMAFFSPEDEKEGRHGRQGQNRKLLLLLL